MLVNNYIKKLMFSIMSLCLILSFVSCNDNETPTKKYDDFTHIDHWDETKQFTEEETLVFYYSPYCEICQSIQGEATEYLVTLENQDIPIYMVHEGFIYEQGTPPLDMIETPSILIYRNNQYFDIVSGSKPILNYLSSKVNEIS
jgi:hypothetical protein